MISYIKNVANNYKFSDELEEKYAHAKDILKLDHKESLILKDLIRGNYKILKFNVDRNNITIKEIENIIDNVNDIEDIFIKEMIIDLLE